MCGATLTVEKELEIVDQVELKKINQQKLAHIHKIIDDKQMMNVAGKKLAD